MAGTVPVQGAINIDGYQIGSPQSPIFAVDPDVGSAVLVFQMAVDGTEVVQFGSQDTEFLGLVEIDDAGNQYGLWFRIIDGTEDASAQVTSNGFAPGAPCGIVEYADVSDVTWVDGWNIDDPFFLGGTTFPIDVLVTFDDGPTDCDIIGMFWAYEATSGGTLTVGTPADCTSLAIGSTSAGSARQRARLVYMDDDAPTGGITVSTWSHSVGGADLELGGAALAGFILTPGGETVTEGDNPAQENTDYGTNYERVRNVFIKSLPHQIDTGLLRDLFRE